jgi:hypothetical protein
MGHPYQCDNCGSYTTTQDCESTELGEFCCWECADEYEQQEGELCSEE